MYKMKPTSFLVALVMVYSQTAMANVDKVGGYLALVTSDLKENGQPIDELTEVRFDHDKFYIFSEWNLPAGNYRYSCIIYDGERQIVNSQSNTYESDGHIFNFWCSHLLDKSINKPGDWYAEMAVEGYDSLSLHFTVTEDNIRDTLTGRWAWSNSENVCKPETGINIEFDESGSKMYHTVPSSKIRLTTSETLYEKITYSIVSEGDKFLRTVVLNEAQRTDDGDVLMWELYLRDDKTFCWRDSSWPKGDCTHNLVKCD